MLSAIAAVAMAKVHTIDWAIPTTGNSGANSQTIAVNDQVKFVWSGTHNVAQAGKDVFDSCGMMNGASIKASSSGWQEIFGGGSEGSHYFICTIGNHCASGMKIEIKVVPEGDPSLPPDSIPGGAAEKPCFPGSAKVTLASGKVSTVDTLKEGDSIVAATADGSLTTDTVSFLSLAKPSASVADFVHLRTASANLTLTPAHHLPVGKTCCSELKQAKDVVVET